MSKLLQLQFKFAELLPVLQFHILSSGYKYTLGDGYRDPRVFGPVGIFQGYGHPKSNHKNRLAIDLNLFFNGQYLDGMSPESVEHYTKIGAFWEDLDPDCAWGGHFKDYNHFSLHYNNQI